MGTVTAFAPRRAKLTSPLPLKRGHDLTEFDCDRAPLNDWLRKWAWKASESNTAKTYVVCRGTKKVVAYAALAAGATDIDELPSILSRNCPDPMPAIVLARLAVDKSEKGQGLGRAILSDAMKRAAKAARVIGAKAILVHALDEKAVSFYEVFEFRRLYAGSQTMFIPMKTVQNELGIL
jgi:GNAT superfamily N-acetyltransferase